ncbi:hypothetical protein AB6B39_07000 [Algimonas porphyrae]|uniref:hypothetical protein n=1 Tax=Algimonas porphyrae TaxID=1128113 RepID=UPI00352B7AF7
MKKTMLIAAALAAGLPGQSQANPYEDEVVAQLLVIQGVALTEGYEQFGDVAINSMSNSTTDTFVLSLDKGMDYIIVGACDSDCGDIDFRLYDDDGDLIEDDVSDDDVPVVEFSSRRSGEYYLEIEMFDCTNDPCTYGIMTLER